MGSLSGKVIIVTGASRGIGAAAASALAREGATVMLAARDGALAADVAQGIIEAGGLRHATPCDVSDYAAVEWLVLETEGRFGRVDALINNAGVIEPIATIADSDPAEWARNIEINLIGAYNPIRARAASDDQGRRRHDRQRVVRRGDPAAGRLERVLRRQSRPRDADAGDHAGKHREQHSGVWFPAGNHRYRHAGDDPRLRHQRGQQNPAGESDPGRAPGRGHRLSVHAGRR